MIKVTRVQLPKWVARATLDVNMSLMPSKVIRKETCLWNRSPFGLLVMFNLGESNSWLLWVDVCGLLDCLN